MGEALATPARTGLVLGRYRPLRPLGSGGSGSVWLARDEVDGFDVALKIVAREGKAAQRAEREAAAAAKIRHPACPRVHAIAHDADHVYIAYEHVAGRTLRDALRAGAVTDRAAVEVAAQLAEVLAHAHARGIVHRDVKPSNVLVADASDVSIRLLDFGLARMDSADTLTEAGDVPGTLAYIAPERLAGEQATPASDVWSVGVLLWEALAGEHPFWRPSLVESARAVEAGAPSLRELRPDLPRPLAATVDRALSLDPCEAAHRGAPRARAADAAPPPPPAGAPARRRLGPRVSRARPGGAAAAGLAAGLGAAALPFFPAGWPAGVGALAFAAGLVRERLGLAVALAAPVFPLGNLSLGVALLYGAVAVVWFALFAREPRGGLLPAAAPLLALAGAAALLPLGAALLVARLVAARARRRGGRGGRRARGGSSRRRVAAGRRVASEHARASRRGERECRGARVGGRSA